MARHTKLPQPIFVDETAKCEIIDSAGCIVADCWDDAYASEIVKRCNLHNELMSALEAFMQGIPNRKSIRALLTKAKGE